MQTLIIHTPTKQMAIVDTLTDWLYQQDWKVGYATCPHNVPDEAILDYESKGFTFGEPSYDANYW
jgi:hypothetical protein